MQKGIVEKSHEGQKLIRIGGADQKVTRIFLAVAVPLLLVLAVLIYRKISPSPWRVGIFIAIYVSALLFYGNAGVWLHEQLHVLGFRDTVNEKNAQIFYSRIFLLGLKGHYSVTGIIAFHIIQRALLMPLVLAASFIVIGFLGSIFLPGWWLPICLSLAVVSVLDMIHDIYMVTQIRRIGDKGIYQDTGNYIEVMIRE